MRISDWSSDVCSSDLQALHERLGASLAGAGRDLERLGDKLADGAGTSTGKAHKVALTLARLGQATPSIDRKSVVSGTSVSVRVDLGGRRIIKQKNTTININRRFITQAL